MWFYNPQPRFHGVYVGLLVGKLHLDGTCIRLYLHTSRMKVQLFFHHRLEIHVTLWDHVVSHSNDIFIFVFFDTAHTSINNVFFNSLFTLVYGEPTITPTSLVNASSPSTSNECAAVPKFIADVVS